MRIWCLAVLAASACDAPSTSTDASDDVSMGAQTNAGPVAPADAAPEGFTMAGYEALQNGMSYGDAVRVIGSEGKQLSSSEAEGVTTTYYLWGNPDTQEGAISTIFQNGKLVQKAQNGMLK